MGIQVDFGPELGLVDFGDMPEEQVRATIREQGPQLRANLISRRQQELAAEPVPEFVSEEASNRGRVTSAGQSAMRGGGEASGKTVSGFARVLEALGPYLSAGSDNEQVADIGLQEIERRRNIAPTQREAEIQQDPLYQAGQEIASGAREAYQPNPAYAGEFLTDVIPNSAGAMAPTIASSMAGGPIGPLLAALQYGSSAGQSAAEEAIAAGRPDLAQQAFAVNAPIGAVTEGVLGAAANLGRLRNLGGGSVVGKVARTALSEAAQEGLEQVGGNLAARGIGYDPNRGVFEGVPESMAAGALLGGGMGGGVEAVDRLGQRVQDRLSPDFSLTPLPQDQNPLTPPPEWFNRQAQVQEAASVAIATLDQQIAQANPVSPLEANTLVADNAARKMEVLAKYLEAQRAAAVPPPPRMAPAVMAPDAGVGQFLQPSGQTPFNQLIGANRNQEARRARVAAGLEAPQAPEVSFTRPITQDEAQSGIAQAVQPEAFTPFDEALRRLPPLRIPLPPEIAQVYSTADKVAQDYLSGADVDPAVLAQLDQISAQIIPQIDNRIRAAFEARVPVAQIEPLLRVSERLGAFVKEYANEKAASALQEEDRYQRWLASAGQPARVQPQAAPVERPLSGLVQVESTTSTTSPVDQLILAARAQQQPPPSPPAQAPTPPPAAPPVAAPTTIAPQPAPAPAKPGRKPAAEKEKANIALRQSQWASDPVIADLNNYTPEEAERIVEDSRGPGSTLPKTNRTELLRFMSEVRAWIEAGAGGKANDLTAAEFQPDRERIFDAIMRDVVRNHAKDSKDGLWQFNLAWKRNTSRARSTASREITEIRKTARFATQKSQVPSEITTDDGETINIADTTAAASQQETKAKSVQLNSELSAFVEEKGLREDEHMALLIRTARERSSPQITEEMLNAIDPDRRLESMSRTDMIEGYFQQLLPSIRDILYSLNGPVLIPVTQADAQAAVTEAFGELPNVRVINDPNAVAPNGESAVGAAAWIDLSTGQITVNAAFIESKDRAVMAVMEEGVHAVWSDPAVKAAWDAVKARIDQAKIDAQIARGYSADVALEEAAVAEVLDYIEQNRKGGPIGEFLANLWTKLKELLGVGNEYDAQRNQIIQRALQALKATPAVNAQQDAEYMAAVERGDTATAQRMVDEAAKRAGYSIGPVYHGTPKSPFNEFDPSKQGRLDEGFLGAGFYFSGSRDTAWLYAEIPKTAPQGSKSGAWRMRKFANRSGYVGSFLLKGSLLELQEQIIGRRERDRTEVVREALGLQPLASARQVTEEALRRGYSGVRYTSRYGGEEYVAFSPEQIKSTDAVTRDDAGNVVPLSQRFSSASSDIRFSRGNGLFLSRAEASEALGKAQQVGGDVGTIAQTAQIQGELIPRSIVSDVEALGNSANRVEKLAARILSPLKSIGDLADQTWLTPFTRFNPSARMASDGGSAAEIAAEAVVRADLAIRAKQRSVKEKLVRAEAALMEAIDNLPKAVVADSDATMNRIEGDALIEQMDMALANELKLARSADVPDALAEAAIIRASRALGEARKDIGSGIGSALSAIARELPAQLTTEPTILNWIGQRLADKSQPRIMSEAVEQFLTTRLPGSRTIPLQRVELAPLMARLRKLNDIKEQAKTELEQFKKDFHGGTTTKTGKGKAVSMRAFAKRFANFQEKYKAALALSRELNAKAARAQDYYDALTIADEKFTEATESISYREKLKDAVGISNAGSGSLKILLGDNGQLNGTISIPNPLTKQIEVVDLSPMRFKRLETQTKLNELAKAHEIALEDIETDPYDRVQLARNLSQIRRMQDAGIKAGAYIVDLVPEQVPILGGLSYIPLSRIHHDAPWFGKRLSAPNNVVTWVSGAAGKQVAGIMAATDIAAAQLEKLRSDSDRSKPSQENINRTTVAAIDAHGMDRENPESQREIADHFSEIISQAQRPEQRPYRVGDFNPVSGLPVLKEDIAAVEAQKQWATAVYKVGQRAKPNSIGRNIAERPAQQSEVISGKSITRIAADYGLKMPRQASISTLPVVRDWSTAMNKAQKQQILEDNFELLVVGMVMETDPDFTTRFSNEDREIFASAIAEFRSGNRLFNDVNSFIQWWGAERAAMNGTTVAEEMVVAEGKLYSIVDGFMRDFAEYAGVGEKSQMTVEDREKRNTPDSLMTIASADNQFTRPRGKLIAPSTLYSYDVTGIAAQESLKTNLLNVFHYEHIKAWTNVKSALKSAMETWDRRKKEMVGKGMRERDAIRKLQLESRKGSASIRNEADYATLRNTVGHIEAMVAGLTRAATERLSIPEDAPVVRTGKSLVGLSGASMLMSPSPSINNLTGGAYGSALIASWLNRTSTLAAGVQALARVVRNSIGRILKAASGKMGWFDSWLKSNKWAVGVLADMVATSTYQRQLAEDALTVDSPDTQSLIEMRLKLPGSGGVVDPGRSDHLVTWLLNQLQSGMGIPKLKSITPKWLHRAIDTIASTPVVGAEYTKRLVPAGIDRGINVGTGSLYREWLDDPAIKKALFDHWSRKEALGGFWDDPANPDFQFGRDDLGDALPDQSRKLLADVLAPIGSLERLSLDWYNRAKGMSPAARLAEPLLLKDKADQYAFEVMKLTNQRAESTTPSTMKGKGGSGLARAIFWQFARYGANNTDVLRRRFAAISGDQDRENRWLAGFLLAATMAFLGAVGLELKGAIKDWIEREPRTTPTIAQAGTDPEAALRYAAASITPFLHPTGTELVQSVVGGQTKSTPFDLSQKVPMLGQATALARAVQTMVQTGDVVYPAVDFIRTAIPITKAAFNIAMPGDAARREAARAVRAAAPVDIELKEFGGGVGGKQTPMTPLIRSAINSAMEGDSEGYREAFDKAVAYQVSKGKTAQEAKKTVESAISAKDPIQSVVGRRLEPVDEARIISRMSSRQRSSFLRARSLTSSLRGKRPARRRTSLLRKGRKKAKRTRLL